MTFEAGNGQIDFNESGTGVFSPDLCKSRPDKRIGFTSEIESINETI